MTHTPGPWRACKDGACSCGYIFGDGGQIYVAQAHSENLLDIYGCPDPFPTPETAEANLHLIVAAPDLLDAAIKTINENLHLADGDDCTLRHLKAAVAKATRRS